MCEELILATKIQPGQADGALIFKIAIGMSIVRSAAAALWVARLGNRTIYANIVDDCKKSGQLC
jgi:hypothetical protein